MLKAFGCLIVLGFVLALSACGTSSSRSGSSNSPPPTSTSGSGSPAEQLIAKTKSGIIRIESTVCDGASIGTGFLIAPNLVATVEHVVDGATRISLSRDGKSLGNATVIGADPARDLALLRSTKPISGYRFSLASSSPSLGEDVLALGFPFGLPLTVTKGSVSGLGRTIPIANVRRRQLVQTDAAVNPGNSGGPLLATDTGQVVGLVDLGTSQANGTSFAVSAGVASALLNAWRVAPQPAAFAYCGGITVGNGPSNTPNTSDALTGYLDSVVRVLEDSASVRQQLVTAIAEAHANRSAAQQALALVIAARRDELASAVGAAVPSAAQDTQVSFVRAFRVSLTSDVLYQRWLSTNSAGVLQQAQANDKLAVIAKAQFLARYNGLRRSAGLPLIPTDFPF